jgi:hypothetical protein
VSRNKDGENTVKLTGSSGDAYSAADSFKFQEAHKISRDFFRVSSILQAVNKAAAAASYISKKKSGKEQASDFPVITLTT